MFFWLILLPFFCWGEECIQRELLITGCARSGTTYISQLFKKAGFDLSHDHEYGAVGTYGLSSWLLVPDAAHAPWGPVRRNCEFQHIFHQTRHPLQVISSVYTTEPKISWIFILENIPEISWEDPHVVKAAKYWYYWNQMAETIAEWRYKIEDIASILPEMEQRLGISLNPALIEAIPTNTNTRGAHAKDFTWEDLKKELDPELFWNIAEMAIRYGYSDAPSLPISFPDER